MSLLDAYASTEEYLADTGQKMSADALLSTQLTACSRLLEKRLQVAPGAFNPVSTTTYTFDGPNSSKLWLRDGAGLAYFLRSIDNNGLAIDDDQDGAFDDYTLDTNDAGVILCPENASAGGEPYTSIELRALSSAPLTKFPAYRGCIRITGSWGWATVPDMIKRLVIHRTHELREAMKIGATQELSTFEG